MAEQVGNIVIVGTIYNLCFYEMNGKYYVRQKPGPDRKAFKQYAKYKTRREAGNNMVQSARLASAIYKYLPPDRSLYYTMQKQANLYYKVGIAPAEVLTLLTNQLVQDGVITTSQQATIYCTIQLNQLNKPGNHPSKKAGHFSGVRVRSKEGHWFRLYHHDELQLLQSYGERLHQDDTWLTDFLIRRKALPSYRLKHRRRRRARKVISLNQSQLVSEIRVLPTLRKLPFSLSTIKPNKPNQPKLNTSIRTIQLLPLNTTNTS